MPLAIQTLVDLFMHQKDDATPVTFIRGNSQDESITYKELYLRACKMLYFLQQHGVAVGHELVLQVEEPSAFLVSFWACILGGIIPVPVAVGRNYNQNRKLFSIWNYLSNHKPRRTP